MGTKQKHEKLPSMQIVNENIVGGEKNRLSERVLLTPNNVQAT